jgi:hypothetical protein
VADPEEDRRDVADRVELDPPVAGGVGDIDELAVADGLVAEDEVEVML